MGYVDRSRGGGHRAAVRRSIDAFRLVVDEAVKEHLSSLEYEAAATNRRLAGLSKLANLSLSVQLIKCPA